MTIPEAIVAYGILILFISVMILNVKYEPKEFKFIKVETVDKIGNVKFIEPVTVEIYEDRNIPWYITKDIINYKRYKVIELKTN